MPLCKSMTKQRTAKGGPYSLVNIIIQEVPTSESRFSLTYRVSEFTSVS